MMVAGRFLLPVALFAALFAATDGADAKGGRKKTANPVTPIPRLSVGVPTAGAPRAAPARPTAPKKRVAPLPKGKKKVPTRFGIAAAISEPFHGFHAVSEGELPAVVTGATCPDGMSLIDGRFCVDRYEGTLVEILPSGDERPWPPFGVVPDNAAVRAVSVKGVVPQGYISAQKASQACALSGKRLCKPVEWRKACMGGKGAMFGYGGTREPKRCNDHGKSPMLEYYPQVTTSWKLVGMTEMNDPRLNQMAGTLAKTGEHEGCTNDYDVYDMVGNLHEWTSDPNGTFQGGYYLDTAQNGDGCSYRTTAHEFTYHDYSTGFRCCADAMPPATDE